RSALALGITLSLILLSPGGAAWAQVAEIAGRAPTAVPGSAASAAASLAPAAVAPALTPSLSLTTLSPAFSAPSAFAPAPSAAAPMAAPALAAPAALPAAAHNIPNANRASGEISAVPAQNAVGPSANAVAVSPANSLAAAPAASALEGVRRELPDFSKVSVGDSKGAATADFLSRVGELFHRAPALSAVPAAADGRTRASGLSKSAKAGQPNEEVDGAGNPVKREGAIDGIGNPTRTGGEHGPDDRQSPDDQGPGNSGLFSTLGVSGL